MKKKNYISPITEVFHLETSQPLLEISADIVPMEWED